MARWRIFLLRVGEFTLDNCNWRVPRDSDGAAQTSRKIKQCKHQSDVKRCILHAKRHKTRSLIYAGLKWTERFSTIRQSPEVGLRAISTCLRQGFGENNCDLERNFMVLNYFLTLAEIWREKIDSQIGLVFFFM